jgi:Bacterial mobilisation protein (MobC)
MPTNRADYLKRFQNEQRAHGVRRVSVTLSAEEYAALAKSADRFNESPTTHLKRSALSNLAGEVRLPPELASRMDALLSVVRGVGNNLNQLARHSNEMRAFLDTNEVRLQLRRLNEEVKIFLTDTVRNTPASR